MNPVFENIVDINAFLKVATESDKTFVELVTDKELVVNPLFVSAFEST